MLRRIVVSSSIALAFACSDDPGRLPESLGSTRPDGVQNGLLYTVNDDSVGPVQLLPDGGLFAPRTTESGHLVRLDLSGDKPELESDELPAGFARSYPRPQHPGQVVVLTSGHDQYREKRKVIPAENAHVLISNGMDLVDHTLGGNFNELTLSDDGRFAVAFSPSGNQAALNAIEVVDLNALGPAGGTSTLRTLGLDGRAPTRILFSPAQSLSRRLLVVLFPDAVQLLDLEQPNAGEISIPLKIPSDPRTLSPQEVLFHRQPVTASTAVTERIYVRSAGSNQILVLTLMQEAGAKLSVATSLITAANAVSDIELVDTELGSRMLILANGLEVVDLGESQTEPIRVPTASEFSAIHPFRGASPVDAQPAWRAMLYALGSSRVGFVEVSGPATWATRSVELAELGEPLRSLIPLQRRKLVLALHGGTRLSIIDLEQRRIVPINLESNLASLLVDETEQHARLWTANESGIVSVLDLVTRKRTPIPVAFTPASLRGASVENGTLVLIPGTPRRVALVQEAKRGRVTTLNADFNPDDVAGTLQPKELVGFFFAGLFD